MAASIHRSPPILPGTLRNAARGRDRGAAQARILSILSKSCSIIVCSTNGRPGASSSAVEREDYKFFDEKEASSPSWNRNKNAAAKKRDDRGNIGDRPHRFVPGFGKFYLDELDVITLLDPPYLSPLDPASYNHASFIWKKIGDISEERRTRLLDLLRPRLMQAMWKVCGNRYYTPKLFPDDAFSLLPAPEIEEPFKTTAWRGKVGGDFWPWSWLRNITMEFFIAKDDGIYGRLHCSGLLGSAISRYMPLYFKVMPAEFVSVTNEECDLVLDFSGGQLHLQDELPSSFPQPEKLSWPLEDFVVYIRPVGPGVLVGQLWDKRADPKQAPPRNLGTIVLIKSSTLEA